MRGRVTLVEKCCTRASGFSLFVFVFLVRVQRPFERVLRLHVLQPSQNNEAIAFMCARIVQQQRRWRPTVNVVKVHWKCDTVNALRVRVQRTESIGIKSTDETIKNKYIDKTKQEITQAVTGKRWKKAFVIVDKDR